MANTTHNALWEMKFSGEWQHLSREKINKIYIYRLQLYKCNYLLNVNVKVIKTIETEYGFIHYTLLFGSLFLSLRVVIFHLRI